MSISGLDIAVIAQEGIAPLRAKLPVLSAISVDMGSAVATTGVSVTVPLVAAKTAGAFSGNYTTDSINSVASVTVTLNQSTDSGTSLTDAEQANAGLHLMTDFATEDFAAVSKKVIDYGLSLVTVANYQLEYPIAAASFAIADVIKIKAMAANAGFTGGTILLNETAYAAFLTDCSTKANWSVGQSFEAIDMLGFKVMSYAGMPTTDGLIGLALTPGAIAVASRPVAPQPDGNNTGTAFAIATDPDSGIALGLRRYYSNETGKSIQVSHVVHGASVGLSRGLIRIVSTDQNNSSSSSEG